MCRSPLACSVEVDQAVLGQLLQHVVEKADAGRDLGRAGAVEIDPALDPRLLGVALDRRDPHRISPRSPHSRDTAYLTISAPSRYCRGAPPSIRSADSDQQRQHRRHALLLRAKACLQSAKT